jgi:hypothetical protein
MDIYNQHACVSASDLISLFINFRMNLISCSSGISKVYLACYVVVLLAFRLILVSREGVVSKPVPVLTKRGSLFWHNGELPGRSFSLIKM